MQQSLPEFLFPLLLRLFSAQLTSAKKHAREQTQRRMRFRRYSYLAKSKHSKVRVVKSIKK
jgi:hypothetical protein